MRRLAIVTTHPIQYYAPVFQMLSARMNGGLRVFYTSGKKENSEYDQGFGRNIEWNIPLLEGYSYEFVENISAVPGAHHFKGIVNPSVIDRITGYDPHAILVYGWSYHSHWKVIRHFSGKVPLWFRGDSTLLDERIWFKQWLRRLWLKRVYRHIDIAFYTGTANWDYFRSAGLREEQLKFAPHAVDNERFALQRNQEVHEFRNRLQIPQDAILVLFAGKLEEKKDPLLLLRAFLRLEKNASCLLFVGNGDLENELKNEASKNPGHRIFFMDFQNQKEMPVVYQSCDLFCLPSKGPGETWGLAVNEAMAAGKAVLISDKTGCATDLVHQNKNGSVFHAGNEDDLLMHLDKLVSEKNQLMKMGSTSRQIIQDWSFSKQVEAFMKQINQLA